MSKKIKVLNLFAGIGGNRKLWENVDVTAVELNPDIASIYMDFFPDDEMIVGDAHQFLLENFDKGYDFIWASPPCPTHSRIRLLCAVQEGKKHKYPDMMLYEEIIFLKHFCPKKTRYCIENVISYYEPLVKPQKIGNHYYWTNFYIIPICEDARKLIRISQKDVIQDKQVRYDIDLYKYEISNAFKRKVLDNCVEPGTGKHIFDCAFMIEQKLLFGV